MQSTYTSPLHGPIEPAYQAYVQAEVAQLQALLPGYHTQLTEFDNAITHCQVQIAELDELIAEQQQEHQAHAASLTTMHETFPSNFQSWSEEQSKQFNDRAWRQNNCLKCVVTNNEGRDYYVKYLAWAIAERKKMQRRVAVIEWRAETLAALSDPAAMTTFPTPPAIGSCRDRTHVQPTCQCHIRAAFWLLNVMLKTQIKAERVMWHPLRFSCCDESKKAEFKKIAKEISAVLAAMDRDGMYS